MGQPLDSSIVRSLLLEDEGRPADSLYLEVDGHLDAVGDFDQGNAFIHSVIFTIEGHRPCDRSRARSCPGKRKVQLLGFGNSADRKVAIHFKSCGTRLDDLGGLECYVGICFRIEKILTL